MVEEQQAENKTLKEKVGTLEKKMDELQTLLKQLAPQK